MSAATPLVAADALAGMLPAARTALVVIDVQVDFCSPEGVLGQQGIDMGVLEPSLRKIEQLLAAARSRRLQVALARVVTRAESDSRALKLLHARKGYPEGSLELCREGTPGVDYYRIAPQPGDIEVKKLLYSSFHGTDFEQQLRARGIENLVVCGYSTDCCIDATVREAFHRDFNVFIVADASNTYDPGQHAHCLEALAMNCALLTDTDALLSVWN